MRFNMWNSINISVISYVLPTDATKIYMQKIILIKVIKPAKPCLVCVKRQRLSGGRLNKKDGLTRYGDSHVKDKTS